MRFKERLSILFLVGASLTVSACAGELFLFSLGYKPLLHRADNSKLIPSVCRHTTLEDAYKDGVIASKSVGNRFQFHPIYGYEPIGGLPSGRDAFLKNRQKKRVLFLGDSFTMGASADKGKGFVDIFSNQYSSSSGIINTGVGGYGQNNQLNVLKNYLTAYRPHHVYLGFYAGNDFEDNMTPVDRFFRTDINAYNKYDIRISGESIEVKKLSDADIWGRVLASECEEGPRSLKSIKNILFSTRTGSLAYISLKQVLSLRSPHQNVKYKTTESLFRQINTLLRASSVGFTVVLIPENNSLPNTDALRLTANYKQSMEMLDSLGIDYIDLYRSLKSSDYVANIYDNHWNNRGHAKAARALINHYQDIDRSGAVTKEN